MTDKKLHIFNPGHDIALAHNDKYFTAPKAARRLRADCGFIPALWASDGDFVLVADEKAASEALEVCGLKHGKVSFVTLSQLKSLPEHLKVSPWGWDSALCFRLNRESLGRIDLPDAEFLDRIRQCSNRKYSSVLLKELRKLLSDDSIKTVGASYYITDIEQLKSFLNSNAEIIVKEPWSSSGRGVRKIAQLDAATANWVNNVIRLQGGIMVEPYYKKVIDFGMEFTCSRGEVSFNGLSLFRTVNGFYEGNMIAAEEHKAAFLSQYVPQLEKFKLDVAKILKNSVGKFYDGPLGVDMMIVDANSEGLCVHPMVEINLRRTMGHVALEIFKRNPFNEAVVRLVFDDGRYRLDIRKK